MEINRHNYEAYLLDLVEGRLSVTEQQQLQNFLLINPDCGEELSELAPWILRDEKISFQNKQLLKKEIPTPSTDLGLHNFDMFSIARMEGDLSSGQSEAHQHMLEIDEQSAREWERWQQSRLKPEPLVYHGKNKLKHKEGSRSRVLWISIISSAAALALILVLLGTGPKPAQQELSLQTIQEEPILATPIQEAPIQEVPVQEIPTRITVSEEVVALQVNYTPEQSLSHATPADPLETDVAIQEEFQAGTVTISAQHLNRMKVAGEVVPDRIEPLHIPPVPIHLSSLSAAQLSELDLQAVIEDYTEEKDFSLLTIANAGIKGINKVSGSNISLLASRNKEGEVSGYQLKSKRFSFTRPLTRKD